MLNIIYVRSLKFKFKFTETSYGKCSFVSRTNMFANRLSVCCTHTVSANVNALIFLRR